MRFKAGHMLAEKQRIAVSARGLLAGARVLGLTGGTTMTEFARTIVDRDDLTVVTNALNIAVDLLSGRKVQVFVAGGEARNSSYETVGPLAEEFFGHYNIDVAVLGVDGVDADAGCTVYDPLGARTARSLMLRARRTIVLADGSKIGKVALTRACRLDQVDTLVTDSSAAGTTLDSLPTQVIVA